MGAEEGDTGNDQRQQRMAHTASSPSYLRQGRNQGVDPLEQPVRIARNLHRLLPAGGAGDNREIAARQMPRARQQQQQRVVGAAALGGAL
jgi:hypothetical protein